MHGYSNLACSSPPMASNGAVRARRSLELTNTKETNAWEGLAIGAVTLARTFSTGSHRISTPSARAVGGERSRSGGGGGLPGAVRRAFSMRRQPAGFGKGDGYYWRIHDMDGDTDGVVDNAASAGEEHDDEEEKMKNNKKKEQLAEAADEKEAAATKSNTETATEKKKRSGNILRACKKLLRLHRLNSKQVTTPPRASAS
ncbi:hypothetical protein ABZP36_013495 [Zizania latifolia]